MEGNTTKGNTNYEDLYNSLKAEFDTLQGQYNELESKHNTYKLDTEFEKDIVGIKHKLTDKEAETLKSLKKSGDKDVYNLLLDKFKNNEPTYSKIDKDGNRVAVDYKPGCGNNYKDNSFSGDLFSAEISKIKGGN